MAPVEYTEFVKKLQAHHSTVTHNWDVAVTYEAAKINKLLADEYKKPNTLMHTKVTLSFSNTDYMGEKFILYYEFDLKPPVIQFDPLSSNPTCSLEMAIESGRFWAERSGNKGLETTIMAGTYSIKLSNILLGTITTSGDANTVKSANNTITFPDNTTDEHIVVDFATSGSNITSDIIYHKGDITDMPLQMQEQQLGKALKGFFYKSSAIAYTLAIINNATPDSKVLDLVPKSFRIVCHGDESTSYLTLLIETKGSSGAGITDSVQSLWDGQWGGTLAMDPVPKDMSAAIILNKSFFIESYLQNVLLQDSSSVDYTKAVAIALPDKESGFKVEFDWATISRPAEDVSSSLLVGTNNSSGKVSIEARTVDPNQGGEKLNMVFGQSDGPDKNPTIEINWSYKDNIKWSEQSYSAGAESTSMINRSGTVIATYKLKPKKVELKGTLTQEAFSVSFDITKDDWSWGLEAEGVEWTEHLKSLGAPFGAHWKSTHIPQLAKQTAMHPMTFHFDFGALRFFSLTNVLLPGRKVIDVDMNVGMRIPNDVVIVGNVVKDAVPLSS